MRPHCPVVAATLLALWSPAVAAVVPGADAALERAAAAWPEPVPLVANLVDVPEEGPPRAAMRLASDGAGQVSLEVQDLRRGRTVVTRYGPTGTDDPDANPLDSAPAWVQWLTGRPVQVVAAAMGLDRERTSLDHAGGTILVVVGAGPHDEAAPRLRLERETGRLRGLVEREPAPDAPASALHVRAEGRAGEEGPRSRWPARLVMARGDERRTWRVDWLRMGDEVPAGEAPGPDEERGAPDDVPAPTEPPAEPAEDARPPARDEAP